MTANSQTELLYDGYAVSRILIPRELHQDVQADLVALAERVTGVPQTDLDTAWNQLRSIDRRLGSLLYNAGKLLPSMHRIAAAAPVLEQLQSLGMKAPVIVDVNFRIDSHGEGKFLFGWHQDYWFSICSPAAMVAWIPLSDVRRDQNGGVEIVPRHASGGRILKTRPGETYNSYADAVVLDESVPRGPTVNFDMNAGDVLFFRFDVLHRSLPVLSPDRSRWTLQVRYADLYDDAFRREQFKPGVVNASTSTYLQRTQ